MEVTRDKKTIMELFLRILRNKIQQFQFWPYETLVKATNCGAVKGTVRRTVFGGTYYAFEGIPFAKPPLGKLRFRSPELVEPWSNVLDCTKVKPKPLQTNLILKIVEGSEDCLYLNVFVNKFDTPKKLPVIVWIYGGGFQIGEASRFLYSPDYFMEREVVLVTVAYRVGAFDSELNIPGNAGLKDQIMALQWIRENIHHFNGDNNNITLIGQSAGAASVNILMHVERVKGLFHKAVLMSGTALCHWLLFPQRDWEYRLAIRIGYTGPKAEKDILEFLENKNANEIAKVQMYLLSKEERHEKFNAPFGPIVEPYFTENAVITKPIIELLENAWGNEIPIILGDTADEGLLLYENAKQFPFLINDLGDCETLLPKDVQECHNLAERRELSLKLKNAYFGVEEPNIKRNFHKYLEFMSSYYFWHGVHRTIKSRLAYAPKIPTFHYRFVYDSPCCNYPRLLYCGSEIRGAIHSSELPFLFFNAFCQKIAPESTEYRIIQQMIGICTAFASTSDPNCEEIRPIMWGPIESLEDEFKCLKIGEKLDINELPEKEKLVIWDSLYTKCPLY